MQKKLTALFAAALFTGARLIAAQAEMTQSLAGTWQVRLDPEAVGESQQWAQQPLSPSVPAQLPGSLTTNHIGDEISLTTPWLGSTSRSTFTTDSRYAPYRQTGNFKVPFWLQPTHYYKGKAWYQREVYIPADWTGKSIELSLERCHWGSAVWIDGTPAQAENSAESLSVPHRYNLGSLAPGKHRLTVCIDNNYLIRVGQDASSVTDHTQTNWNGIIGNIELSAHAALTLKDQQIYPQNDGSVRVKLALANAGQTPAEATLTLQIRERKTGQIVATTSRTQPIPAGTSDLTLDLKLAQLPQLWSEFSPHLYTATASLGGETRTSTFGFREIRAEGRTILVNNVPTYMRGNLDCASFPLTGHPSTEVEEWRRIYTVYKNYGLNHVRFHSWCPPKAAFIAADEEGMYLQVECGIWRGPGGDKNAKPVEPFMYKEAERILREYGNHPSFVLFTHGNEPWELNKQKIADEWTPAMKKLDSRHLVCAAAHYIISPNNDYHNPGPGGGMNLRYHQGFNTPPTTASDYEAIINKESAPCISHEPGEWCVFPNLKEIPKYTGPLKARNFEIVRDFMAANHLLDQADDFLMASGKFQTLIYKEETEKFLRTRGLAGFQMLGLNDFPGQGTALVGVVDVFWNAKPYVTAAEYKKFSGPIVPLALMEKRTWTTAEVFKARIRIAHYGAAPLMNIQPKWEIIDSTGQRVAAGSLPAVSIPVGNSSELGEVALPLNTLTQAAHLNLRVTLPGTDASNNWSFWVYPEKATQETGKTVICHELKEAMGALNHGESVLLLPKPGQILGQTAGTFAPIFWNKPWFPGQREHTLGLLIQNQHPALSQFPTDSHADWQWWDLMTHYKPLVLDALPPEVRAIVQPIDDWNTCRRLGMLLEANVGTGKLMIASCNLETDLENRPVARQFRASILGYMKSAAFQPKATLSAEQLSQVIIDGNPGDLITKIEASSHSADHPATAAGDNRPETCWQSAPTPTGKSYAHELRLDLAKSVQLCGLNLLPNQDGTKAGWVKELDVFTSLDGAEWQKIAQPRLDNNHEWKAVNFPAVAARFIKLVARSPHTKDDPIASFAEVELVQGK